MSIRFPISVKSANVKSEGFVIVWTRKQWSVTQFQKLFEKNMKEQYEQYQLIHKKQINTKRIRCLTIYVICIIVNYFKLR